MFFQFGFSSSSAVWFVVSNVFAESFSMKLNRIIFCISNWFSVEACSHGRSHQFFAESVLTKGFTGYPCHSYEEYNAGKCQKTNGIPMGDPVPRTARGVYYLKTSDSSPYSQGR